MATEPLLGFNLGTGTPEMAVALVEYCNLEKGTKWSDLDFERELVLEFREPTPTRVLSCETITGPDLKAVNPLAQPRNVVPRPLDPPRTGTRMTFKLPARSHTVASLTVT